MITELIAIVGITSLFFERIMELFFSLTKIFDTDPDRADMRSERQSIQDAQFLVYRMADPNLTDLRTEIKGKRENIINKEKKIGVTKRKRMLIANFMGFVLGFLFILLTSISFFGVIENDLSITINDNFISKVLDLILSALLVAAGTDFVHKGVIKLSPSEFNKNCKCVEIKDLDKILYRSREEKLG